MSFIRRWFKAIIFECVSELKQEQVKIIATRPPTPEDNLYSKGSVWQDAKNKKLYYAKKVTVKWKRSKFKIGKGYGS